MRPKTAEPLILNIEKHTRVAVDIGHKVVESRDLVLQAKDCQIGIRNETVLRHGVPVKDWEEGLSLSDWVVPPRFS